MLSKATLTNMTTLESLAVLWNPSGYGVSRQCRLPASVTLRGFRRPIVCCGGVTERFHTRLFLDSTEATGPDRDLRWVVEKLESWAQPGLDGTFAWLVFAWGSFRFRGLLEEICQEWVRFDPDGTGVRAWVDLTLRR